MALAKGIDILKIYGIIKNKTKEEVASMVLVKIGQRIVNLQNVKFIELMENDKEREIRFYFVDGSYSYVNLKKDEEDRDFETVWEYLSGLWVFSSENFFKGYYIKGNYDIEEVEL